MKKAFKGLFGKKSKKEKPAPNATSSAVATSAETEPSQTTPAPPAPVTVCKPESSKNEVEPRTSAGSSPTPVQPAAAASIQDVAGDKAVAAPVVINAAIQSRSTLSNCSSFHCLKTTRMIEAYNFLRLAPEPAPAPVPTSPTVAAAGPGAVPEPTKAAVTSSPPQEMASVATGETIPGMSATSGPMGDEANFGSTAEEEGLKERGPVAGVATSTPLPEAPSTASQAASHPSLTDK